MADAGDGRGDGRRVTGDSPETRWMSYAELAEARGIREPAAVRLVQRRKWERQHGNDGTARIAVPVFELRPSRPVAPDVVPVAPDITEALNRERERADAAEAREAAATARATRAEQERDQVRQEREDARVRAAMAEGEAKALREALGESRRPAWRRWLGLADG